MADYRVELGVKLKDNDIQSQINDAQKTLKPIQIKVDAETKELTNTIKEALKSLSNGTKNALTLDTSKLEASLNDVTSTIREIKTAMGTLDSGSNTKSLLSSINSISTALDKASDKFDGLIADLKALSGKDFSVNLGLNLGGSNSVARQGIYGSHVRSETLPELKKQAKALQDYFKEYYKVQDELSAIMKLAPNRGGDIVDLYNPMSGYKSKTEKESLSKQMGAYREYINIIKEAAAMRGIDITHITSGFSKSADQLVQDAQDIQTGAKEMDESFEKLKQIFGGGSNLNIEGLSAQLEPIIIDLGEIRKAVESLSQGVSIDGLIQSFDRLSETLEQLMTNAKLVQDVLGGKMAVVDTDTGEAKGIQEVIEKKKSEAQQAQETANIVVQSEERKQQAYRETANEAKKVSDNAEALKQDLNFNDASIDSMKQSFQELGIAIDSVTVNLKNGSLDSFTIKGTDGIERTVSATKKLDDNITKITQSFAKAKNQADKIKFKIDTKKFDAEIIKVTADFNNLSLKSNDIKTDIKQLNHEFANMQTAAAAGDIDALVNAYKEYERILESVNNKLDINKTKQQEANRQQRQNNSDDALIEAKKSLRWDIDNYLKDNTAAANRFGDTIRRIRAEIDTCDDSGALKNLKTQFQNVKKEANHVLNSTQSFGDKFKKQWQQYASYFSVAEVFMYAEQALRSMFEQVKLIDSAMTELKKVTDETDESYNRFLTNAADRARDIGTTIDGLVNSTADFARLGYGFEDAQGLAEVANIYAVVGDEINGVEGATESLISTMAAFKNEMNGMSDTDFAMNIIDKFNEIGNNFAISSGGIGEALERSASSLMAANNTIDESIALITAANTVVQDPEQVGTAFKTISMRIRGAKTELEEAGLETDGMVQSTAKLRSEILALTGVDIMDGANQFKSTYKIMDELAVKWKDLTDIQQATVTELIAGKRQGNIVSSLMTNFDTAREALETSMNSAGSAMKEHEKWQQSLEARINNLKASWQSLSQAFLSSDFLKDTLDTVIKLVDALTLFIDKVGTIPALLTAFGGFKIIKTVLSAIGKDGGLNSLGGILGILQTAFPNITNGVKKLATSLREVSFASGGAGSALGGFFSLMMMHPYITAAVIAVTALTAAFMYQKKKAEDLSKEVDELTDKYKQNHEELKKLQSDYDTSNESSMISKYAKLSKGVDNLGRNVSLTADEYSEYQSIVNTIAEQIPSLVSGYDSQGNALLSCKGNVEALTEAYQKLIHAQNQEILANTGNIDKDFANTVKDANNDGWFGKFREWMTNNESWVQWVPGLNQLWSVDKIADWTVGNKMTTDTAKILKDLLNTDRDKVDDVIAGYDKQTLSEIKTALKDAGVDVSFWSDGSKELEETIKNDSAKIKGIVDNYYGTFVESIDEQKTIIQAKLSEAFDVSSAISGLNYGNINEELQTIAHQTMNGLDFDFFEKLSESGKTAEQWTDELLKQLDAVGKAYGDEIENVFELQGKFNSGEVSYGEYVQELKEFDKILDSLNLKSEAKEQLKISVGLDEGGVVEQYNNLVNRLTSKNYDFNISKKEAEAWLNRLSSEDFALAVEIITETSNNGVNETIAQLQAMLDKEKAILGLSLDFKIDDEKAKLEALATAISESISGSGLSTESLSAIESMFSDISGYDPSKLFERTANGIRLNTEEFRKLNSEYKKSNVNDLNKEMDTLGDAYVQTREELSNLTYGTDEYNDKARELDDIKNQINEVEKLAAGYEGLASAYQEWQMMESAGSQRDMYENIIEGFENIDDEISRGWYDDGTIEFLELLTGKDLSVAGINEIKKAYKGLGKEIGNTGYSVRDFFTTDEDGNSTNTGVYNFLRTVENFESKLGDVIKKEDGKIVGFDFQVAGGDEAIADALDISEELVQIMVRAADDAGFVVSMDGTYQQLDVLVKKAQEAAAKLKNTFKATNYDFFQDGSEEGIVKDYQEALKLWETFKKNKNKDGTVNMSVKGAQEAFTLVSTLQSMVDQLNEPVYMELNTSDVEKEMQTPLSKLQEYERLTQTEHQLKLKGTDTSSIEASKNKILDYFEELSPEIKADLGIKNDSRDEIAKKLKDGTIKIPATIDLQVEMNETLKDMVNVALYNAGIIEKDELEKRVDVNVYAEDVDTSDVEDKTKEAIKEKGEEAVAVETRVELETTINEAVDLIQKLEDKDITINVKVEGIDQVKELHKQIDLATNIDGNVDKLSKYVENAKVLNELDDNVASFVTAEVKGNVLEKSKKELNRLGEFAEHAKTLQEANSKRVDITANVEGNVIDTKERKIDNLETFIDSAKGIKDIEGDIVSNITANTLGSVFEDKEKNIDNLDVFIESAKGIKDIEGDIISNVTANTLGSVFEDSERTIDNLDVFIESAKGIKDVEGDIVSNITANTLGSVFEDKEKNIDNLKTFIDSAKGIKDIEGNIVSNITANTLGSVFEDKERKIDNLDVFVESAKGIKDIEGDIISNITANVNGNVVGNKTEGKINNLKVFVDSAKNMKSLEGEISSKVTANVEGNVFEKTEGKINNLKVFVDSAKGFQNKDLTSKITANIEGNVFTKTEGTINNLDVFVESAKGFQNKDLTSTVTANVEGNAVSGEGVSGRLSSLTEFKSLVQGMSNQTVAVNVTANVDSANINQAITLLTNVANSGVFKDYNATVQVGAKIATIDDATVQNYKVPPKDGKVKYSVDPESSVYTWTAPSKNGVVNYSASVEALTDAQKHKTGTITYKAKIEGGSPAAGTASPKGSSFSSGSSGRAFAHGDWGIKGNGVALGGELGRELVVRDGKFFTIGDSGAEFFRYRKNDIVFNAAQTESLFKYGGIKGAKPRGKMFASGTAFIGGSAGSGGDTETKINSKSVGSDDDKFEEVLDWIETILDRVERSIDKFDQQANNIYKSWSSRNQALISEISEINNEISLQQSAYSRYMQEANKVGLSSEWAAKVQSGAIDIDTITNEDLADKIGQYQEWYEKALDCQDAIQELKETEASLYAQRLEHVSKQYEGILGVIEHEKNMLDEYISQSETQSWLVSAEYYNALAKNERETIKELENQKSAMLAEFNTTMNSGAITEGSEAWYEMVASIDEVTLAIEQSNTALFEYSQTIQQLSWETFDLLQDKISSVVEETEFLIDLMSSDKLFDDNGKLTDKGNATMGLHGQNYNAYMYQADLAAKEADRLKKELAKDPYDTDLEERYREMIALQQEYILSAQDEKEAIKSLVEEGIELEIEALEERIDKYNEAIESQKDLYDYQRKVSEQTANIASLQKQIASYENDDSEESRAKVQELRVSLAEAEADLQETEYDKYISDTQQMLDDLTLQYSEIINMRLDNIDALISDVITEINTDASSISTTITEVADSVGYTLSDSMQSIWDKETTDTTNVITTYGEKFSSAQTTTNNALSTINSNLQNVINQLNSIAKTKVKSASTSSTAKSSATNKKTTSTTTKASTTSSKKTITDDTLKGVAAAIWVYGKDSGWGNNPFRENKLTEKLGASNAKKVQEYVNEYGSKGVLYKLWTQKKKNLSSYMYKAFATGARKVDESQLAWTQENGQEFIVRPSDGAILTPIAKGDSVLTSTASNNIWDMANSPTDFIKDNLKLGAANVPNNSTVQSNYTQHIDKVVFDMKNVKNYEELLSALKSDKNFDRLIKSMTIDQIAGKSSLAKGKSIR